MVWGGVARRVWWWEEALGGVVSLAVVTGCGACAGRAAPPHRLGLRSLGSSGPTPMPPPPPPPPPLVLSLHPGARVIPLPLGARPPWSHLAAEEEEEVVSPPARASGPSPSSCLSLFPLPLGLHSFHPPNFVASRESLEVCVCLSAMGVVGGVDEGACAVAVAWPVAVRVGRWGASGWRVCASCPPLVSGVRLSSPAPPWPGGWASGWGGGLSGGGLGATPPPCLIPVSRRRPRAWLAPLPPTPASLPPFLQVPSAFRRGGLKTPGGTACPPRGRGGGPVGSRTGPVPSVPP